MKHFETAYEIRNMLSIKVALMMNRVIIVYCIQKKGFPKNQFKREFSSSIAEDSNCFRIKFNVKKADVCSGNKKKVIIS